jgi:5-methylthioadenosine/S-adenosylhomocysteine deaminase
MTKLQDLDPRHDLQKTPIAFIGATLLDAQQEIRDGILVIHKNKIIDVGERKVVEARLPKDVLKVDARGYLLTPGLINGHTHCSLSYLRSLGHGQKQMIDTLFFKTEPELTEKIVEALCYSDLLTGLLSGVTTFVDHYYFHRGTARAIDTFGLRGVVSDTLLDIEGPFAGPEPFENFKKSLTQWNFSDRIVPCVGPHSSSTTSPALFRKCVELAYAEKLPIHFHLSQTQREWNFSQKTYGKSPVAQVASVGALGPQTLAVHLLHESDEDLRILKDSGATIAFCASSQIVYEKLAPIDRFVKAGIPWTIGTDAAPSNDLSDVQAEMKIAALFAIDRGVSQENLAREVFKAATLTPARCLGLATGLLEKGYLADLVFHELTIRAEPNERLYDTFVFSLNSQQVAAVMVDGRWRAWRGQALGLDLLQLSSAYREAVQEIHEKLEA